jgi:hypothetical protein
VPQLIADFRADLNSMARQYLDEHAPEDMIADNEVLIRYFDSLRRWPVPQPRKLHIAHDFHCPDEVKVGWDVLRAKVTRGESILPHLSMRHSSLANLDGLLNDWGVHHLHLGTKPHAKDARYVRRTKRVLLALITEEDFYAINVLPSHGGWEAKDIIESLHRNWPCCLASYKIGGIRADDLDDVSRRQLRRSNIGTFTCVSDGTTYGAIGGGVVSSGVSFIAVRRAAQALQEVKRLQTMVQNQIEKFLAYLRPRGYSEGCDVRATLIGIRSRTYTIFFPEFNLRTLVPLK